MANVPSSAGRDAGLVRRIGPLALVGTFVGTLLGSGIFNVPAPMAAAVGSYAPLAYLGCGLAVGAVMICIAEGASRVPTSGGIAGFVDAAFGPYWGFLAGTFNYVSALLACGAVAAGAADVIGTVVPAMAAGPVRTLAIIAWFALLAAINTAGVGIAARFVTIATGVKLVPLILLIAAGVWFIDPANLSLPMPDGGAQIGRAAILGIFIFTGTEASLAVAGEVRDPARTIPRALVAAMLGYAAICIIVQLVAQGLLGDALAGSKAPLAQAAATVSPWLGALVGAGAAMSMLGYTASDSLFTPRMLFALSREGFLPGAIGRTHPRTHAPWVASITHAAIAASLTISGSFATLAILATLFCVLIYLIGCAAAVKLRAGDVAQAGPPVRIPGLHAIALAGCAAMIWIGFQSTWQEAAGIALFVAAASLLYRLRRTAPQPATAP
ncbi:APC family permease [Polymorphobacter fuscus]|uniref:Arginine/agmatine antiporter n=1 Tax=Sandarakinorhabdus fusca TaxID=1439888 RepID=A0A7C9KM47_9SPHN|nr:APC family permease [Polymorphobacter fuscus]KAB7646355.1 APC family permease [Polymorphobacter fuscus]MQT17583.1 amino acid permease [Polymorphobacter fuscus]NJC09874.1 amino acid transporter [Polymorphobacter fuscus]